MQVYIGETLATNARWVSDTRLECRAAAGVGARLDIRVRVAMQDAVMADARAPITFAYDGPLVGGLLPRRLPLQVPVYLRLLVQEYTYCRRACAHHICIRH